MGVSSIFASRIPIPQELPVFNSLNTVYSQPHPAELTNPPLPLLSGKYPHFHSSSLSSLHSDNALQVNSTGFTPVSRARPFPESRGKESQNSVLQGGSSKTGTSKRPNKYKLKTSTIDMVFGIVLYQMPCIGKVVVSCCLLQLGVLLPTVHYAGFLVSVHIIGILVDTGTREVPGWF